MAIENEKDVPAEEKEESENAAIEMSVLAVGTSKDIEEEQQAEGKTEDNKEADGAQSPPPAETPGLLGGEDAEECQTEAKTEGEEEADGAQTPTETPGLPAGTSDDAEECQTEAKTEGKEEADGAQMPPPAPSSEMPGTGTSKDIESQKEEEQTGAVLETAEKGEEESFLFAASVCSTWIPSVVGDPEQRFFLKAGEPLQCTGLSLVS